MLLDVMLLEGAEGTGLEDRVFHVKLRHTVSGLVVPIDTNAHVLVGHGEGSQELVLVDCYFDRSICAHGVDGHVYFGAVQRTLEIEVKVKTLHPELSKHVSEVEILGETVFESTSCGWLVSAKMAHECLKVCVTGVGRTAWWLAIELIARQGISFHQDLRFPSSLVSDEAPTDTTYG